MDYENQQIIIDSIIPVLEGFEEKMRSLQFNLCDLSEQVMIVKSYKELSDMVRKHEKGEVL